MASFKDINGKVWTIQITGKEIRRTKNKLGIDLLDLEKFVQTAAEDFILLIDIIYLCCLDECEKNKISDEQFGGCLAGDSLEEAIEAFMESLIAFFPKSRRVLLQKIWGKRRDVEERLVAKNEKMIEEITLAQIEAEIEKEREEKLQKK